MTFTDYLKDAYDPNPKQKKWESSIPESCDICGEDIADEFVDGVTRYGGWAIMCPICHSSIGNGLGMGKGQRYRKQGNEFIKIGG